MAYVPDPGDGPGSFASGDPPHGVCISFFEDDEIFTDNPTWTRLDDPAGYRLASGWQISRGRTGERDKTGTGTAQVSFIDRGSFLDPTSGSPLNPFLNPMRQAAIGLMNPVTGDWSTIFTGYVADHDHNVDMWTDLRGVDRLTMNWVDGFDILAAVELTPSIHGDLTALADFADVYYAGDPANFTGEAPVTVHVDDHIVKLLDDGGWPNTGQKRGVGVKWRNIFSGNCTVQGTTYARRDSLLSALFDAADAEFPGVANIYMSKTGAVTFHGRFARFHSERPGYGINSWKCGSLYFTELDEDVAPISGLVFRRSMDDVINACICLPYNFQDIDVPTQLVKDNDSIEHYGWRSLSYENLIISKGHDDDGNDTTNLTECLKYAHYYVDNFAQPQNRVTQITFRPRGADQVGAAALWEMMCGVEIGDKLTLKVHHPYSGTFVAGGFNEDFFVEGIHYEASPARTDMHDITMTLDVSPAAFFDSNPFGDWDDSE